MNCSIENFAPMDKKHKQHSKNTKKKRSKSKRKDNETEVFVIPPDLLQKLGINLGNVQSTQECPITEVSNDTTGFKNQLNSPVKNVTASNDLKTPVDCEKETSILETANLMTTSVFLSPTFTPVCANIIPGELEISNAIRTEEHGIDAMHKSNHELNTNILKQDTLIPNIEPIKEIEDSDQLPQEILENHAEELSLAKSECNSENDLVATPLQENHIGFSNDVSRNTNMEVIQKTDRKISTDDHLDEAYSSDCSNSNLGPIENSDSLNYTPEHFIKSPTQITSKNKINIISEEILSPSQLNELKSLHSPIVSDFIPVTIHTVISWNKKNDKYDNDVLATDSLFHKQDYARNALKINNIEGRNHSEDNIILSTGLPVQIQAQNICLENKYIDDCNLLKEVQEISCTINKNMSQMSNEEVLNDNTKIELDNSDSNLGVCIDFEVMDLDKHLEENVEILEEFVNGITSNDSDEILEKLEQNEKICFNDTKLPEMAVDGIKITDNFSSKGDGVIKEETHSENESNSNITCVPLDVLSNIDEKMHIDTYDNLPNNVDESKLEGDEKINAKESAVNTFDVKQLKEDTGIKNDENISLLQTSTRHDGELIKNSEQLNNEFSLKQHYDLDVSNIKNSSEDSVTKMSDEKTNENDALKNRTSDANVPIEKVEEIAMYLSQCLSSRRLKSKAVFPKRKEIIEQTKQNCFKSKLCIQGVEKPGGSKENVKNAKEVILKTYGRVNRSKKKNVPELNETKLNDAVLQNESGDLKLQPNSITLSYDCTSKKFCLCHDFGSLTFYDCNSEYEHIHFWEHDNIDCDRDVIFSMYVEDYSMDLYNSNDTDMITDINDDPHDNPKVIGRSICWNNIRDDLIGETCREVPNNADAGTADCLNESIHYSQNLTGTTNNENVENEEHPHENRSGYIPKITVEINYEESEFDGLGFQTAGLNKTKQIDYNHMENVDKTNVDDKIIQESPHYERRRSSETTLNTIDKEPSKIIETRNNPIIEEISDVHSESSKESSSLIGSRSNNKNEKKNMSKRKRSSKMIEEEHGLDVRDNEPYSKKSIKCGICAQFLSENEWENHIGNEHCYIAWRQGKTRDSVDLNDLALQKKLDQILTINGKLKCSFCEVKKKTVEKFLSHVRKCLKLLDSPNTSVSCTSRSAEAIREELESISTVAKHGRNKYKSTSTNVKAREDKIKSINPEATGKTESTLSELIEAEIMTADSHGKRKKSTNPQSFTESPESTSNISELISEEIKSPSVYSKASNKKRKSPSTPKIPISQEQDPKSVSLSPELKREKLRSSTNSSKTISDKSKSLNAKTSTISKPFSEELTPPPDDSKTTIKKRKSQSIAKNQITQEQDPTPASLKHQLKTVRHKSTSNASETTSDKPKLLEAKAGSKNRKSKSSNSESFAESPKASSSISEPICEELKSPPVESKVTTKKSKLQLTPKTQITQEQDPKSAALSPEHKREKPKSISNASETTTDKPKSLEAKAGSKNRKSKSSYLEPFAESPKASSSISEPIRDELNSPPVESKATIKKRKLQSTPMTQLSQEQDPKSASLSSELKKEQLNATSTPSETISDKLKSSDAKASRKNRKSKSINTESISEEPKSTATTSERINKEPIATSIESMYKSKEKESKTINLEAAGKRKSTPTEPIIENLDNNSDAISQESQSESPLRSITKCGVCQQEVENHCWIDHIAGHDYLAWEDGSTPLDLDNEEEVSRHLNDLARQIGGLKCSKCGLTRKYLKAYLQHIVKCNGTENSPQAKSSDLESRLKVKIEKTPEPPKCGVCQKDLTDATWMEHIATEHNYLAWRDGETPLDLDDEEVLRLHLHTIAKQIGELVCSKCGLTRKYAKSFLQHINHCEETVANDDSMASETNLESEVNEDLKLPVTCGVCKKEISSVQWILHIQKAHNYLAWKEGESLDINNAEEVQNHLYAISKAVGGLICSKCGLLRKYVKAYQHHFANCTVTPPNYDETIDQTNKVPSCGVCSEKVELKDWINHKVEKHYNIAWTTADIPIDIKNPYAVERLLKEYKDIKKKFVCNVCGSSRVSCMGFYAHILTCGKSEEETEMFQNTCEVCHKQYLCIYQNQHMAFHREQEYARERKLKEAEQKAAKVEVTIDSTSGRRRAAEKARTVIEKYKTSGQFSHNCPNCGFGTDSRTEIDDHVCTTESDFDDSDASVHSEGSDDDSEGSGVDSNVSKEVEEQPQTIKKRIREYVPLPMKIPRLPFSVTNPSNYLVMCGEQLCKANSTTENLFADWKICQYEPVADDQLVNYLPPLEESCKVKFGEDSWTTYSRFEAKKRKGYSIFVGACIQCISWAPCVDDTCNQYLAVTCHPGADLPRYERDVTPLHSGLIQIWNFGDMRQLPEMALGIAHDYGTVWNMDWCPYGARDVLPTEDANTTSRLGLLAISCSNGHAYVFSVPYPSTIPLKNDKLIYKLKAVAELRLTMGSDRQIYQATTVRWSQQKDQSFVVVGYGDGTTAYFDLNSESPLLKTKRNDVTIFYPYHDERPHNACVLGLSVYPGGDASVAAGAVCSASPTGAEAALRPGLRPARLHSRVASSFAMFQPHWPAALLAGDDAIMSSLVNELEWWGGGRRLGAVSAHAGCAHCARVASFQPPLLRVMRLHPVYSEANKQTIGSLQMMPLGKKRKVVTDELTTKLEPITYEEAIQKYGIEFKVDQTIQAPSTNKPRDQFPERFPLGDVRSMAFCPSFKHHGKLAVATHAGIIFLISI